MNESQPGFLSEVICREFGASATEAWVNESVLYQPYEIQQALLYEYADCLAVRTFLKMCKLPYTLEQRANAEYMSPTGKVPFLRCGPVVISEIEPIVDFVAAKNVSLSSDLSPAQRALLTAGMSLVKDKIGNVELYVCWIHPSTVAQVTRKRYGSPYPFPLNHFLAFRRQREMNSRMHAIGWAQRSIEDVLREFSDACEALSVRLGEQSYFFGDHPTELDALVFGHLYTILTTELPDVDLATIVKRQPNLIAYCQRIEKEYYFQRKGNSP